MSSSDLVGLLVEVFEVEHITAANVAEKWDIRKFDSQFSRLEGLVGSFENASKVLKEGEFLRYYDDQILTYFELAQKAASKMEYSQPIPIQIFYSIGSLTKFLKTEDAKGVAIDPTKLKVAKYRLLHRDNTQSQGYLNSLIEDGELTVGKKEHWTKSGDGGNGLRGLNIIRKIAFDLSVMFDELGLPKPEYKLNNGQMELRIPPYTGVILGKIRDAAYSLQK